MENVKPAQTWLQGWIQLFGIYISINLAYPKYAVGDICSNMRIQDMKQLQTQKVLNCSKFNFEFWPPEYV